jgi:hypothetical protein
MPVLEMTSTGNITKGLGAGRAGAVNTDTGSVTRHSERRWAPLLGYALRAQRGPRSALAKPNLRSEHFHGIYFMLKKGLDISAPLTGWQQPFATQQP